MRSGPASHLIVTLGVLSSAITGTAGAVLTVCIAPGQTGLALAELALALAAALLIAAYGMTRDRGRRKQAECGHPRARR